MKIGYSKTYPLTNTGCFEKIWLEDSIETTDMEEVKKAQYKLKRAVEDFHYGSKAQAEKQAQETVLDENGKAIAEIMLCKTIADLETYQYPASQNKAVKAAYNQKLKQLQNGLAQY